MIQRGDTVRFLNAVGGGIVSRVDTAKSLVYVEDEDGFEIPTLMHDCVVVPAVNENTNFPKKEAKQMPSPQKAVQDIAAKAVTPSEAIEETPDGDTLKVALAFFPVDIKQLQTTAYDCYLVNDSNYFLFYNIVNGEKGCRVSVANGMIEPNMQEELCSITKEELNDWEQIQVQIIPFKQQKTYSVQAVVDTPVKLNTVKFYKLHSFTDNEYFDEPAMIIDLIAAGVDKKLIDISPEAIKKAMFEKEEPRRPRIQSKVQKPGIIEVDLHIHELVDTTAGMSNTDMLRLQIERFHAVLAEHKNHKGQKVVFIHGKGEGVLRKEIEKQLRNRYNSYYFQDASFREYGFGATMVTIK